MGLKNEAFGCFDKAEELKVSDPEQFWDFKGQTHLKFDEYYQAIKCFNKVLSINPKNARAWNNKGKALNEIGNIDDAQICFNIV